MSQLGKYLLLDRIAVGGMAEIYRAKSFGVEGFEKIIAIKRILPALAEDSEFVAMFVEEAKIAGQLSHANIAPIYELGKIGDTHFIAMEYVWGKDMLQIMSRFKKMGQAVPPQMAAWIASKMCEALDYAHRKRGVDGRPLALIHRDVSPQNVLVSYDGLVKIIDFGIAKAASRATQTQAGVIKGKLGYMSPEQIMGRTLDHRSDIFAMSTCLHEMLSGDRLFTGPNDISVIDKVRNATAAPPGVHPALDAIVMKGLAREVADRYQTAGEMQEDLMRYIMMNPPPYSTSALAGWMRTAFASEVADERAHLDHLTNVAQPGVPVTPKAPPVPKAPAADEYDFESEATVITDAGRNYVPRAPGPPPAPTTHSAPAFEESFEELSQIVIVENLDLVSRVGRDASSPVPPAPPRRSPPTDYASTVVASAAYTDDGSDDEYTPAPQRPPAPSYNAPPVPAPPYSAPPLGAPPNPAMAPHGAPPNPMMAPLGAPPNPMMQYGSPMAAPLPVPAPEPVPALGGQVPLPPSSFAPYSAPAYEPPTPMAGFSGPPAESTKVPSYPPRPMKNTEVAPGPASPEVSTPRIAVGAFVPSAEPPPAAAAPVKKKRSILPWIALMLTLFVIGAALTWIFALGGRALLGF